MTLGTVLIIILILILVGAIPVYPYNRSWGYYPGGIVFIVLLILIVLVATGRF